MAIRAHGNPWNRWAGPLITIALVMTFEFLRHTPLRIANPPAILHLAIVYAGFTGGLWQALASALFSWIYSAYFFSDPGFPNYSDDNLRRIVVWAFVMPLSGLLVGILNRREARALARAELAGMDQARAKEREQAREELRESEARFRTFVDHAADAFFLHDTDDFGRILDVNRHACESLGFTRDELIGSYPREFDVGLTPAEVIRIGERVAAGEVFAFETRHRRKDGTEFPAELRVRPFQHGGKRLSVALARDISERKQAEKAVNESYDLLRAVVEGTPDAILVKDLRGRYRMINSSGARILGKSTEEVIGKEDQDLLGPEDARAIRERDLRVMATGETETFEETVAVAEGARIYLSTKSPFHDRQGNVVGMIGIARDITAMKRLEIEFRQAQKMEALGRLAGGVAHDFNNLLMIITGYCELVFNRLLPDDPTRMAIAEVQKAGGRAVTLTRQLLAFSRKQVLQPQVVGLNHILLDLCTLLQRLIGENFELKQALAPGLGMAKVDPGQFEQAIINLAVNARDAMTGTGCLTVATRNLRLDGNDAEPNPDAKPGEYVVVSVSDTGCGMDEATKARIFEPFFTTKEIGSGPGARPGTGLGLAMVYGFVTQSGGHIEVESGPGRGSTFRLFLPRSDETLPAPIPAHEELRGSPGGGETILLAEDEEAVRVLARLVLQSHGYTVMEASDGQDALRIAEQYPETIHMLITDMVMPRMGGRELAGHLARSRPETRVLFMSGYTDDAVLQSGEAETGGAFVHKPIGPLALARKVRQLLDAGGSFR
jgi:two-component system cell cycle sensor histidine kinase/response regulator CckA